MRLARSENTKRTVIVGEIDRLSGILLPFFVRTLIIRLIGAEYLGLTGLFYSIVQTLSLAELGFGTSIVFSMYRPLADNDTEGVRSLLDYYARIYRRAGSFVSAAGLCLIASGMLPRLVKGPMPAGIRPELLFSIYLVNTLSTFFLYPERKALLTACQREDLGLGVHIFTQLFMYTGQALAVILTRNYYLYALLMPVFTVIYSLLAAFRAKKHFPQFFTGRPAPVRHYPEMRTQVAGLMIRRTAILSRNMLDAVFISAYLGLVPTAVYSNYYYVMDAVVMLLAVVKTSMAGGVGNSLALESREKNLRDMRTIDFLFMWISGWCAICILCLIQPFMRLWAGSGMMLENGTACLFAVCFYLLKMSDIRSLYAESAGIWWQARYISIAETAANLVLNFILVQRFGIAGVITATMLSYFVFNYAGGAVILFRTVFADRDMLSYFAGHAKYAAGAFVTGAVTWAAAEKLTDLLRAEGPGELLLRAVICLLLPNMLFFLLYRRTRVFRESRRFKLLPARFRGRKGK